MTLQEKNAYLETHQDIINHIVETNTSEGWDRLVDSEDIKLEIYYPLNNRCVEIIKKSFTQKRIKWVIENA